MTFTKKHSAILLTAIAILIIQFIVELFAVYVLFNISYQITVFFYKFFAYICIFHNLIALGLIIWARRLALKFYAGK